MGIDRTPYQNGYEDAQDRGWGATSNIVDYQEYLRGYNDGTRALEATKASYTRCPDHAAELARVEKLLDAARDAARVAIDQMDVWQRACAAASLMHTQTLTANALLRAECEAKQKKIDAAYDAFVHIAEYWNGSDNDRAVADALEVMRNSATDAAGILKGGE